MTAHGYIWLLLIAKSMAFLDSYSEIRSLASPGHARAIPSQCDATGIFCSNCQEAYLCSSVGDAPTTTITCPSTQVCSGTPGRQGCLDFMGEGNSLEVCDCDAVGNSGFLADPYDATRYFICLTPEQQFLATCPDGFVFSTVSDTCVEEPIAPTGTDSNVNCTAEGIGFHTNDPTCQTYTVCFSDVLTGIPRSCPEGQAYDVSIPNCVSECLLGPAAFTCPERGSGAFPDTSDCTIFHVCSNGDLIESALPCQPDGYLFDPSSMQCFHPSTNVECPVINDCWAALCDACGGPCPTNSTVPSNPEPSPSSTTTSTTISSTISISSGGTNNPPNCNNNPGYYAYAADCKQFWSCQDDDAGGYEAILYRCPGDLYFIPSLSYCSLQSDLPNNPGCTITSS